MRKIMFVAIGIMESILLKMKRDVSSTEVGRVMQRAANRPYYGRLQSRIDAANDALFREADGELATGVCVKGWGEKKIVAQDYLKMRRRYFVSTPASTGRTLNYYEDNSVGKRPRKQILVADALLKKDYSDTVIFSEQIGENSTRLLSVKFDHHDVADAFVDRYKNKLK
jgi:hypothetical protein